GRARRARIKRDDLVERRAVEEEREPDRNRERLPLPIAQVEVLERPDAPGNALVSRGTLPAEEDGAGVASAGQCAARRLDEMLVAGAELDAAHLARFDRRTLAGKPAQGRKHRIGP